MLHIFVCIISLGINREHWIYTGFLVWFLIKWTQLLNSSNEEKNEETLKSCFSIYLLALSSLNLGLDLVYFLSFPNFLFCDYWLKISGLAGKFRVNVVKP